MAGINETLAAMGSEVSLEATSVISILVPAVFIVAYALYLFLLPKPLPGIPYDKAATRSILGSLPSMESFRKTHHSNLIPWFSHEASRHNSPICQFWLGPFAKPDIILNDAREAQDLLVRRAKEFGRSERVVDIMQNVSPEFHVALLTEDPRYKRNKALVKDLMSPSFLEQISAPNIYLRSIYLIEYWQTKMKLANGVTFEAKTDVFAALADMVSAAAFTLEPADSLIRKWNTHLQELQLAACTAGETSTALSISTNGIAEFSRGARVPYYDALDRLSKHQGDQARAVFPNMEHWYKMATDATLRSAYQIVKTYETEQIDKSLARMQNSGAQLSAVDHLLFREGQVAEKEGRKPEYYSKRIYDEAITPLVTRLQRHLSLASPHSLKFDESATGTNNNEGAVKHLGVSPDVQSKLRATLRKAHSRAVLEQRQPTALEIIKTSVPYLDAVVEENLRMHPSLSLQNREAMADTVILGHPIPKGTTVWIVPHGPSYTAPHLPVSDALRSDTSKARGVASWADTDKDLDCFRPERWIKVTDKSEGGEVQFDNKAAPMQTFGGGPRACFGRRMAYMQLKITVTLLVWNFEFLPVEENLSSFRVEETQVAEPEYCYVRLREAPVAAT